jgi:putative membrane protein
MAVARCLRNRSHDFRAIVGALTPKLELSMKIVAGLLTALVALEHFGFMALEMFFWRTPYAMKAFGTTPATAETTAVLAANQGLYNGFLAAGLVWALIAKKTDVAVFFLCCVVVAGLYGAATANTRILFVQALPAALALVATLVAARRA